MIHRRLTKPKSYTQRKAERILKLREKQKHRIHSIHGRPKPKRVIGKCYRVTAKPETTQRQRYSRMMIAPQGGRENVLKRIPVDYNNYYAVRRKPVTGSETEKEKTKNDIIAEMVAKIPENLKIEGEKWDTVPYFSAYIISDNGRIMGTSDKNTYPKYRKRKSEDTEKVIQAMQTRLVDDFEHRLKNVDVHRLVASVFVPNDDPAKKTHVHHLDCDPENNRASNLMWVTVLQHQTIHNRINAFKRKQGSITVEEMRAIALDVVYGGVVA